MEGARRELYLELGKTQFIQTEVQIVLVPIIDLNKTKVEGVQLEQTLNFKSKV